jgi:hypothetical protein
MDNAKMALLVLLMLVVSACTRIYKPDVYPKFEAIQEFSSTASITLQNGQPSTDPVVYASQGLNTWKANFHEWTDVAIALANRELTKRGAHVVNDAEKSLSLSVESATVEIGFVVSTSLVVMRAKTSEGYSAVYTGKNKSGRPVGVFYLGEGALMRAVVEMFKDPKIVTFVSQ